MKFVIPGKLDGLNEYTRANRSNKYQGSSMKRNNELIVLSAIKRTKQQKVSKYPCLLEITWYESNMRRDFDNITFAVKFILDSLVKSKIIENDSLKFVNQINHEVLVDKTNPRIEVEIIEKE